VARRLISRSSSKVIRYCLDGYGDVMFSMVGLVKFKSGKDIRSGAVWHSIAEHGRSRHSEVKLGKDYL